MHRERAQRDQPTGVSNRPRKAPTTRNAIFFFSAIPATPSIDYFAAASGDSPTDARSGKGPANRMPRRFTTSLLNRLRLIFLTRQAFLLAYKNESQRRLPTALTGRQQTHRHLIHLFIVVFASNWQAQLPARPQLCFLFASLAFLLFPLPRQPHVASAATPASHLVFCPQRSASPLQQIRYKRENRGADKSLGNWG